MASLIADNLIVCRRVCLDFHQRKHHSPTTPSFCTWNPLVTNRSIMENTSMWCHRHEHVTFYELPPLLCVIRLHFETFFFLLDRPIVICCITINKNWGIPCATNCQTQSFPQKWDLTWWQVVALARVFRRSQKLCNAPSRHKESSSAISEARHRYWYHIPSFVELCFYKS